MNIADAREILGLGEIATKRQITAAYRRASRRWHPDVAPPGEEETFHTRMQEINTAYHYILKFLEGYRYRLAEPPPGHEDYEAWWQTHFGKNLWDAPGEPRRRRRSTP